MEDEGKFAIEVMRSWCVKESNNIQIVKTMK